MENVIIVGSGPAGLTAGIYVSRAGLSPLVIEGYNALGQLVQTPMDEISAVDFSGGELKLSGMMGDYTSRTVIIATGAEAALEAQYYLETLGSRKS